MTIKQIGSRGGRNEGVRYSVFCETCTRTDRDYAMGLIGIALDLHGRDLTDAELKEITKLSQIPGETIIDTNVGVMNSEVAMLLAREHELTYGVTHQIEVRGWGEKEKKEFERLQKQLEKRMNQRRPKFG